MSQNSRNFVARLGIASVLVFLSCCLTNAQDVRTNYMPGTDWPKYRTYAWVDEVQGVPSVGGQPDQILDTQVKQAIDSQMAAKGFTKLVDGGKPDLLVGYQLMIDREKQIKGFGDSWGGWETGAVAGVRGEAVSAPFQRILRPITSGLLSWACMTLLQKGSFGSGVLNTPLSPARNRKKTRKGSTRERKSC